MAANFTPLVEDWVGEIASEAKLHIGDEQRLLYSRYWINNDALGDCGLNKQLNTWVDTIYHHYENKLQIQKDPIDEQYEPNNLNARFRELLDEGIISDSEYGKLKVSKL